MCRRQQQRCKDANTAAGNCSKSLNQRCASWIRPKVCATGIADAHGRWYDGMEDGRRLRRRDAREGSLVPPEVDFEAKAQDMPSAFRCTSVRCHNHSLRYAMVATYSRMHVLIGCRLCKQLIDCTWLVMSLADSK